MTGTDQIFMTRTDQAFMRLVREGKLEEQHRDDWREVYEPNARLDLDSDQIDGLASMTRLTSGKPSTAAAAMAWPERLMTLAREHPAPALSGDDAVQALDREVQDFAAAEGLGYWHPFARQAGKPELAADALEELPPWKAEEGNVDPESAETDRRARDAARILQIGYLDAVQLVTLDRELADAEADDGRSPVEWRDTSRRLTVKPYGAEHAEHFERDTRRAKAAGIQLPKEYWQQASEDGRDLAFELASEARASRVAELRAERDALLEQARGVERVRRQQALDDELRTRARERLVSPARTRSAASAN